MEIEKIYIGKRYEEGTIVVVAENIVDGSSERLEHHVKHSPDGFEWGFGGSGPTELARCILWDHTGEEPEAATYQAFKSEVIASQKEDSWNITSTAIANWLKGWIENPVRYQ